MKILVINAGSSSIKYQLMDLGDRREVALLASGLVERIGEPVGRAIHKTYADGKETKTVEEPALPSHREGMSLVVRLLTHPDTGVIRDAADVEGVGHRVVSCGEVYSDPVRVTPKVKEVIRDFFPLSPLHNPPNLMGIDVAEEFFPHASQVAVFDTAFHQTMPRKAYLYATPYEWYSKYRLRRYGFHGTSHKFIAHAAAEFMGRPLDQTRLISIHLGNGCSMAAIRDGKCVDTTMGVTPLEGLIMGTRSGDLDPAAIEYVMGQTGMDVHQVVNALNKQSGLKGICGVNDMREVVEAAQAGNELAETALQMFAYRIQRYVGAFMAVVPNLQAIVFTAGIGQNSPPVRKRICADLAHLGLVLDDARNEARSEDPRELQADGAPLKILVLPTNEELQIAIETRQVICGG
jgi:acetate kinase